MICWEGEGIRGEKRREEKRRGNGDLLDELLPDAVFLRYTYT